MAVADIVAVRNIGWSVPTSLEWKSDYEVNKRQGIITAYLTVYHKPGTQEPIIDDYKDWVAPGSFTKTIADLEMARKSRNLPYLAKNLWQHNPNWITGGVSHLSEDSGGVIYESKMAMGVRLADEVLELAEQKMVGSSFGYFATRAARDSKSGIRTIRELLLQEVSQVVFPANEYAPIIGVKNGAIWPRQWALGGLPTQEDGDATIEQSFLADIAPEAENVPASEAAHKDAPVPTPVVAVKQDDSASNDFLSIWTGMQPDALVSHYMRMEDALSRSILKIADDDSIIDKQSAVIATCAQFGAAAAAWAATYAAADAADDALNGDDSDDDLGDDGMVGTMAAPDWVHMPAMTGVMAAARGMYAVKQLARFLQTKAGKVLSASTHAELSSHVDAINTHAQAMADFMKSNNPADSDDQNDTNNAAGAGDYGASKSLQEAITSVFGASTITPGHNTWASVFATTPATPPTQTGQDGAPSQQKQTPTPLPPVSTIVTISDFAAEIRAGFTQGVT